MYCIGSVSADAAPIRCGAQRAGVCDLSMHIPSSSRHKACLDIALYDCRAKLCISQGPCVWTDTKCGFPPQRNIRIYVGS